MSFWGVHGMQKAHFLKVDETTLEGIVGYEMPLCVMPRKQLTIVGTTF